MTTTSSSTRGDLPSAAQRERHRRILDVTVALASQGGFEAVQMRAVADGADVALGTLYRYFPSKIHLLVSALAREFETADASDARRTVPGERASDRVMHVLGRSTRALQRDPHLTEALTRAFMFADSSVAREIDEVAGHVGSMLMRAMRAPGDQEHARPTEEERAVVGVISDVWLAGLVHWVTGRTSAEDVAGSVEVAVRLLLR